MSTNIMEKELDMRLVEYAVPGWQRTLLQRLNERLDGFDAQLGHHVPVEEAPPVVMVLGLPRTWTTLCLQLLTTALDVKTVTNIAARFWSAPVTGMMLSRTLDAGRRSRSLESRYGKTADPFGPHEFSYFWHRWFRMEDMPPYDAAQKDKEIDWPGFAQVLADMAGTSPTPLALKALDVVYHLPRVHEAVPRSLFVYLERDIEESALSLAKARIEYYGDVNNWWSMYPPEYAELAELPWHEQVAGQVHGLWRLHEEQLARVKGDRVLRFSYRQACEDPRGVTETVAERLEKLFGLPVRRLPGTLERLTPQRTELSPELSGPLLRSLRERLALSPGGES